MASDDDDHDLRGTENEEPSEIQENAVAQISDFETLDESNIQDDISADRSIYNQIKDLGTFGATSLQRVYPYPTVNLDNYKLSDLPSDIKSLIGRQDLSGEPLEGDMTSDLFLAHRDEQQLQTLARRERRKTLELLPRSFLADELLTELQGLRDAEDAESDTSVLDVNSITYIDEDGTESKVEMNQEPPNGALPKGSQCPQDCILKGWVPPVPEAIPSTDPDEPSVVAQNSSSLYRTLPTTHIRILEVEPGAGKDTISCKFHLLDLDEVPILGRKAEFDPTAQTPLRFEALSYCWGSTILTDTIGCNGHPAKVTRNLYSALKHLRMNEYSRFLWVDALCIDQSNNQERNDQVRRMLKIYKRALRVIIWLGESGEDDGERAIMLLRSFDLPIHRWTILHMSHASECIKTLEAGYRATCKLYQRSWFSRTWIRQELAASRKLIVQCGRQTISWMPLKRGYNRIADIRKKLEELGILGLPSNKTSRTIEYLKRGWEYGQSAMGNVAVAGSLYYWHGGGLLDLLLTGTLFEVTDARDRIYAILGLAREPIADGDNEDALFPYVGPGERFEPMVVDYNSSVSAVYQRLAKTVINRDANLDILCMLHHLGNQTSDLPSWTPDWRVRKDDKISLGGYLTFRFFASGYTRAERQDQADMGNLRVKAYAVDQVKALLDITATVWNLMYEKGEAIILSEGALDNRTEWRGLPVFEPLNAKSESRCCVTLDGHVALVPLTAKPGDFIYVVLGARLPFILRDTNTAQDSGATSEVTDVDLTDYSRKFTLVGPCCLPGFMQGEVFSVVGDKEALRMTLI